MQDNSAYFHSTTTLNYVRALLTSGFASLHQPRDWSLAHVRSPVLRCVLRLPSTEGVQTLTPAVHIGPNSRGSPRAYQTRSTSAGPSVSKPAETASTSSAGEAAARWAKSTSTRGTHLHLRAKIKIKITDGVRISSHEGLMLDYEQALTREFPIPGSTSAISSQAPKETAYYNTSAHFIWIGDRTRQIDGAHVEYFRGIRNPIGIKVGPSMEKDELIRLLYGELH